MEHFLLQVRQRNTVVLQFSKQQIQSLYGFLIAQCLGILSPRFDAIALLFLDLALAHQEEVVGALGWI